jgi:hypothetical protein
LLKVRRTTERDLREFPKRSHCFGHPITVDSVQARCSLDSPLKHSHIEEQLELPTDRRLRHLQRATDLADRQLVARESAQESDSMWIGKQSQHRGPLLH